MVLSPLDKVVGQSRSLPMAQARGEDRTIILLGVTPWCCHRIIAVTRDDRSGGCDVNATRDIQAVGAIPLLPQHLATELRPAGERAGVVPGQSAAPCVLNARSISE